MNTAYAAGATSKIVTVYARVLSDGLPYTGGAFNTAGLSITYTRDGATPTTITPVTATAGTYTSSGFVHRGKGAYEIGLPTAALAAGADGVEVAVDGISDTAFVPIRIELMSGDPRAATVSADVVSISGDTTAADNAEAFFDGTGYVGGTAKLTVNAVQVNGTAQTAGDLAALVTTVDTVVDAIKAKTDNLPSDPADASVVAGLIAAVDAKIDVIDDFLDTEVAAIKAKTDSLTFTQAGHVDANIQRVNDVAVNGDGAGTPWGP